MPVENDIENIPFFLPVLSCMANRLTSDLAQKYMVPNDVPYPRTLSSEMARRQS